MDINFRDSTMETSKPIIYCSGIGGIGLSSLARHYNARNYKVYGSDGVDSELIQDLISEGIEISLNQDGEFLKKVIEENKDKEIHFVHTNALTPSHPELRICHSVLDTESLRSPIGVGDDERVKLKVMNYPTALGELTKKDVIIGVCGTHGKSTTTAMIAKMMLETGHECNIVVGTKMKELGNKNFHIAPKSKFWVIEADEYKEAFLQYNPTYVILTTCEPDHLDYYKNEQNYYTAFAKLFSQIPKNGVIITHQNLIDLPIFSMKKIQAEIITQDEKLKYKLPDMKLPGKHIKDNASLALLFAQIFKIPEEKASKSLSEFSGTWRRFEILGKTETGAQVITDYAHTPTELQVTLEAAREGFPDQRIVAIFEPHQASRVITQMEGFGKSFDDSDVVLIPSIYYVRDTLEDKRKATPEILIEKLKENYKDSNVEIVKYEDAKLIHDWIDENTNEKDLILFMGAGPIDGIAREVVN